MIEGKCDCGAVSWRFDGVPDWATACNCTICRRYGTLWAYDYEGRKITVSGLTSVYARGDKEIGFHFCPTCGCVAYWRALRPNDEGHRRIAVNLRMAEPDQVAAIAVEQFDGLDSWTERPADGRKVADHWF